MAGIYLHIPFCKQACYYCDFHFSTSLKRKDELIKAIANELVLRKNEFQNEKIETIYFGGGTPSLLTIVEIQFLLASIYENFQVISNPEVWIVAFTLALVASLETLLCVEATDKIDPSDNARDPVIWRW